MTVVQSGEPTGVAPPLLGKPLRAIVSRFEGPGGFYNAGNLLGLSVALATQFVTAATSSASSVGERLYAYFAGSPSAVALTVATAIFLFSGETYHRAWAGRSTPSIQLNRIADLLSVGGASALTLSLMFAGQVPLALASGLLIAGGKLGSAITCDDRSKVPGWPAGWADPFRSAVLAGRFPGIAAAVLDLSRHVLDQPTGLSTLSIVPPAMLVVCYALWIKADVLLIGGAARATRTINLGAAPPF